MGRKEVPQKDLPAVLEELEAKGAKEIRRSPARFDGNVEVRWKDSPQDVALRKAELQGWRRLMAVSVLVAVAIAAVITLLMVGCKGSAPGGLSVDIPTWTVGEPTVRIGSVDDPNFAFQSVRNLAMSPAGILHSLHYNEAFIRRWDASGQPAGMVGGQGEGPGEFQRPGQLGFFGDSLWVMDHGSYRISFFDLQGEFLGSLTPRVDMSRDPDDPHASAPRPSRPFRDGTLYGSAPAWSDAIARGQITETTHVRMAPGGGTMDTIWVQPYKRTDILALLRETGGTFSPQPFGDRPLTVVLPDNALVVLDRRTYRGETVPAVHLTKISLTGDTVFSWDLEYTPEPLPQERVDYEVLDKVESLYEFMSRFNPDLSRARLESDLRDAMYRPEFFPAVSDMVVADDGMVWLKRFNPGPDGSEWLVFSQAGEQVAKAITPIDIRVLLIADNSLWSVETDELEVDYIVRYPIVRP